MTLATTPSTARVTGVSLALQALAAHPDRVAFRSTDQAWTYAQTAALMGRMQAAFRQRGVQAGQRAVVLSANSAESWCATLALQGMGVAVSMMHPLGARASHVGQIEDLQARWVVVDAVHHAQRADELQADCPQAGHWRLGGGGPQDLLAWAAQMPDTPPQDLSDGDQPAAMNFTGGTTGRPKCVLRSGFGLGDMARVILAGFELPETPQYLAVAPISHVSGTKIIPTLLRGGTVHLAHAFDAGQVLARIESARINMVLLVPTMIYALLDHPDLARRDLSSLQLVLYGASPMAPARLAQALQRMGPVFAQLYGQTECYPIAYRAKADHDLTHPEQLDACGHVMPGVTVCLLDERGDEVAEGAAGEIGVRAPHVMAGYLDQAEATAQAMAGGWLHTGDIATRDAAGRLTIVDRKKDMIVSGGFNVFPSEVEAVLMAHPDVAQAAVIGVPDEKWGEAVMAYLVLREGVTLDADALGAWVKAHKGAVYRPKHFAAVDALPLTAIGKLDKKALRAPHWSGRSRQV